MSTNAVKLQLPTLMRIYLAVNVSQIVQYKDKVGEQKREEVKPIEVKRVESREDIEQKVRGVVKYLIQ